MPDYTPIKGKNVILYFMKGVEYVPFVCVENFSMDFAKTTKGTKTIGTGNWARPRTQSNAYTVTVSGLIPLGDDPLDFKPFEILDYFYGDSEIEFRAVWPVDLTTLKIIEGVLLPINGTFTGNAEDFADANWTLAGVGSPTNRDTLEICDAEIGLGALDVTVANEGGGPVTITINTVTGSPDHYNWNLDGGGFLSVYSNSFYVNTTPGEHLVVIIPICANGLEGPARNVPFSSA